MSDLETKKKELASLAEEVRRLSRKEELEREIPKLRALLGRYFRFKNSFSGGNETWFVYAKPLTVDADGTITFQEIQLDCRNQLTACQRAYPFGMGNLLDREWRECPEIEWLRITEKARVLIESFKNQSS